MTLREAFAAVRRHGRPVWLERGPQLLAALLAVLCGTLQMRPRFPLLLAALHDLSGYDGASIQRLSDLAALPRMLIGMGLVVMAVGLLLRARVAWVITLLLGVLVAGLSWWFSRASDPVFWSALALVAVLIYYAGRFDRSNLAASSLFALLSIGALLLYGVLGTLWLGAGYAPAIRDLPTAFYYTIETMSTVGYGDILPRTVEARMFTVSMIVLGITVFATTLSIVLAPLLGGSIRRALEGRMQRKTRKGHFVIIGSSSLAYTLWKDLQAHGVAVTVIEPPGKPSPYPPEADLITGDASRNEVLEQAGVQQARAVMMLRDDDAENAFAVLAVKEFAPGVKTIAGVNDVRHLAKIRRVQPDMLFAPQLLGSDLLVRTLFDEPIDKETVSKLLFAQS
ncbi:MAG: voltage-gated potassium channel protein [Steroidobacteraceae bacterium]|nr:voltage-gated potassium channel protein [Steroidobacteraceae bacterium]